MPQVNVAAANDFPNADDTLQHYSRFSMRDDKQTVVPAEAIGHSYRGPVGDIFTMIA
jgi:hypothetical protein